MPTLLNYKDFCENLEEITSLKLFYKKKFHPTGLFSEQIFGPLKNYTCQCGDYFGISKSGSKCSQCEVDIVNSNVRRIRFAKITLPIFVINPLFYDLIVDIGGKTLKNGLDKLMKNEKSFLYMDGDDYFISTNPESIEPNTEIFERTDAIFKMVKELSKKMSDEGNQNWKLIYDNIDNLLIKDIIVLPPDLRPTSAINSGKELMDKINRYYVHILTKKEMMQKTPIDLIRDKNLYYTYFKQLQSDVNILYIQILEKMAKKEGLIRGNILGKRIDFSGRAVITPDPTIKLDECVVPYHIILELYKIPIAKRIIEIGKFKLLNKAMDFVDQCIKLNSPALYQICEELIKDEVCILNRQPSLHKLGMLGFNILITLDKVIKIHPLSCPPFNADFDGDQMAIYIPISQEAKDEIRNKMFITKNLFSPANEDLTTTPSQDIILGIYFLTSNMTIEKDGFKIFNECLPNDYPEITGPVNSKVLMKILNDIKEKYSSDITSKVLDDIKKIGFKYATITGCTLSLDDFSFDEASNLRRSLYQDTNTRKQLAAVNKPELLDKLKDKFKYAYMIDSGARGSWDQAKQMILTRGFVANFDGEILPLPIKHSLVEGLTPKEFFYSTYGCRKGLLDIALNTGTSGYLSRKLIFTCANLQIDKDLEDCGTTDLLEVMVKNERKAKMLVNRFYLNKDNSLELITKENCLSFIGKIINIRSPIFCKSPKICQKCYGLLYKRINTRFIGIIAAQTLGERTTQLVLRTFHTCLEKDTKIMDVNGNMYKIKDVYDIVKNNKSFYTFSCSPDGLIEVSKVIDAYNDRIENKIIKIALDNDKIIKCSVDHKFMLRNGTYVRADELNINDSLMPIYFGKKRDGYKTVRQNKKTRYTSFYKSDLIYRLSSNHDDIEIHNELDINKKIARHHKIKNIEKITLDIPEILYDLKVDSIYHNFATEAGIFLHNSGSVNIHGETNENNMSHKDIIGDLSSASKVLHKFKGKTCIEITDQLFDIYDKNIYHIHFECVVSQLMWINKDKWRLLPNRDKIPPQYYSIQTVPTKESWLLAIAFSNPKKSIINGILNKGKYSGILDKILKGERIQ